MSGTTGSRSPRRETAGGVLGMTLGLLLIAGAFGMLLARSGGPVDGAQRIEDYLHDPNPFGLRLVEAAELPSGEVVVRLDRSEVVDADGPAGAGAESSLESPESRRAIGATGTESLEDSGGTAEAQLASETPFPAASENAPAFEAETANEPEEIVFVEFTSMSRMGLVFPRGDDDDDDEDGGDVSRRKLRWDDDPSFAFTATVKADRIAWDRWQADYSVVRAYLEGGGWQESVRVNLGQEDRPLAMFVRWPREVKSSEEQLEAILRGIRMRPSSKS